MLHRTLLFVFVFVVLLGFGLAVSAQDSELPADFQTYVEDIIADCDGDASQMEVWQGYSQGWYDVVVVCRSTVDTATLEAPEGLVRGDWDTLPYGYLRFESADGSLDRMFRLFITMEREARVGEVITTNLNGRDVTVLVTVVDGVLTLDTAVVTNEGAESLPFYPVEFSVYMADGEEVLHHFASDWQGNIEDSVSIPMPEGAAGLSVELHEERMRCGCAENAPRERFVMELPSVQAEAVDTSGLVSLEVEGAEFAYSFEDGIFCFQTTAQSIYISDALRDEVRGRAVVDLFHSYSPYHPQSAAMYCGGLFPADVEELFGILYYRGEGGGSVRVEFTIPIQQ